MANLRKWSQTATGNASVAGGANTINFAEGQTPGSVNNSAREMMAQVRKVYVPSEWGWVEHSATASVASQTTFKISGNQTTDWTAGRRWRLKSGSTTRYGSIVSSSFTVETTITVTVDSGSLSASHSLAALAAIDSNHIPGSYLTSNSASIAYAALGSANTFTQALTINGGNLNLNSNTDFAPQNQLTHAGATAGSAPYLLLRRARGTYSSPSIVSSGDSVGNLFWYAYDGSTYQQVASIIGTIDGTPGAGDTPGKLTFYTTPDGSSTAAARMNITNAGVTNVLGAMSISGSVAVVGNVGVGHTSLITGPGSITARLQVQSTNIFDDAVASGYWAADANPAQMHMYKSRGAAIGTRGIVSSGDEVGRIVFGGDDGTNFIPTAYIASFVDTTPGANDMPGRLSFWTTADGASSPTERMRITNAGVTNVLGAMSISGSVAIVGTLTVGGASITGSGHTLLGTITTTSGASQTLSSLTLTNYKFLKLFFNGVSISGSGNITLGSATVVTALGAATNAYGPVEVDLSNGAAGNIGGGFGGATGYSTATTSITVAPSAGTFDAGSILVYGVV